MDKVGLYRYGRYSILKMAMLGPKCTVPQTAFTIKLIEVGLPLYEAYQEHPEQDA